MAMSKVAPLAPVMETFGAASQGQRAKATRFEAAMSIELYSQNHVLHHVKKDIHLQPKMQCARTLCHQPQMLRLKWVEHIRNLPIQAGSQKKSLSSFETASWGLK